MSHSTPTDPPADSGHAEIRRLARDHFDKWAVGYDRSRLNELVFFPSVRICLEEIARWQRSRCAAPFRMLDVGCGTGRLLAAVAEQEAADLIVGLDYSPVMIERLCQKIPAAEAHRLHAVVADSERLPFAEASFDVVTRCNSFHHYPHQAGAIAGFARVLRPGGLMVLVDGFRDNVIGWLVFDFGVASVERNVHHASWSELRAMITAAGFRTLRQRKLNVFAPLLVNVATR